MVRQPHSRRENCSDQIFLAHQFRKGHSPHFTLRAVQTPQVFDEALIRGALKKANREKLPITDDSSAVELLGMSVKMVEGEEKNIKITTPLDLEIARVFMEAEV